MNIKIKVMALLLSFVILAGISAASACDTRTPGYWKNHAWPTEGFANDGFHYTDATTPFGVLNIVPKPTWFTVDTLKTPVQGNAKINLEQKVIAAVLSMSADYREGWTWPANYIGGPMNGATLPQLIADAMNLINTNPGAWTPGSDAAQSGVRAQGLALASAIDYWLNFFDEAPIV